MTQARLMSSVITYDPDNFDRPDPKAARLERMEKSLQRLNPDYRFADFRIEYNYHTCRRGEISYYRTDYSPKTTSTTERTPTSIVVTAVTTTPISCPVVYLRYDRTTDTWTDISATYEKNRSVQSAIESYYRERSHREESVSYARNKAEEDLAQRRLDEWNSATNYKRIEDMKAAQKLCIEAEEADANRSLAKWDASEGRRSP